MDIYQALKKDHDKLKPLLAQLVKASEVNEDTKAVLEQIRDELIPHARAEEAIFYNSLREIDSAKDLVSHGYTEHAEAETILRSMQAMSSIGIEWTKAAEKLRDALEHHIAEEEGRIFSAARQVLLEEEARQMATAFERLKPEIREQGFMQNTLDMVANMMPQRFSEKLRSFNSRG